MKTPTFPDVTIVGMHFRERDGVPAKAIVESFLPPVTLTLEREPDNPYDLYAIKALFNGQHIGYVEARQAMFISPWIDQGHEFSCIVTDLRQIKNNLHPIVTIGPLEHG